MPLDAEFQYYLDHQLELAEKYDGKCIVIKDKKVIGSYENEVDAINATSEKHELGTFLVQNCTSDPESTEHTYHSRAHFA